MITAQVVGYLVVISLIWIDELTNLPLSMGDPEHVANLHEAALETAAVLAVAIPTLLVTYRITKRLFYLENFLLVCSWCKRIGQDEKWVTQEQFLDARFHTHTTHGICPDCLKTARTELESLHSEK